MGRVQLLTLYLCVLQVGCKKKSKVVKRTERKHNENGMVNLELKNVYTPYTNWYKFRLFQGFLLIWAEREQYRNRSNRCKTTKSIYIHFSSSEHYSIINSKNRLKKVGNILKFIQENSFATNYRNKTKPFELWAIANAIVSSFFFGIR